MYLAQTLVALSIALNLSGVSAALYPTQPIASTIYYSGKQAVVSWKETRRWPSLEDMGDVRIELICKDEYVTTLENGVSPTAKTHTVAIPGGLADRSDYMIRFRSQKPPLSIYTAYFTIKSDSNLPVKLNIANATVTGTQTSPIPIPTSPVAPPVGTIKPSPAEPSPSRGSEGKDSRLRKNNAARLNSETSGFRTAAVLLPPIMGILMAL